MNFVKNLKITESGLNTKERDEKVFVSLTSYPKRIHTAAYAIKTLMKQIYKPDRIILYLSKDQFIGRELPDELTELQKYGLEILFVDGDLKSHKKYYYILQEQRGNLVVTYDDDILYDECSLERLINKHLEYPDDIICNRGIIFTFDSDGKLKPSAGWKLKSDEGIKTPSMIVMPSTGGGVLYPPDVISKCVFNVEDIQNCAIHEDDLWIRCMSILNNTRVIRTKRCFRAFSTVEGSQTESLSTINVINKGTDESVKKIIVRYPRVGENLYMYIKEKK